MSGQRGHEPGSRITQDVWSSVAHHPQPAPRSVMAKRQPDQQAGDEIFASETAHSRLTRAQVCCFWRSAVTGVAGMQAMTKTLASVFAGVGRLASGRRAGASARLAAAGFPGATVLERARRCQTRCGNRSRTSPSP